MSLPLCHQLEWLSHVLFSEVHQKLEKHHDPRAGGGEDEEDLHLQQQRPPEVELRTINQFQTITEKAPTRALGFYIEDIIKTLC